MTFWAGISRKITELEAERVMPILLDGDVGRGFGRQAVRKFRDGQVDVVESQVGLVGNPRRELDRARRSISVLTLAAQVGGDDKVGLRSYECRAITSTRPSQLFQFVDVGFG